MINQSVANPYQGSVDNIEKVDHILTVDLEDWFHGLDRPNKEHLERRVEEPTRRLLDLFETHGASATFFVLGDVAKRFPALIRDIVDGGHSLGTHGMQHRNIRELSPETFRQDLRDSLHAIEDAAGISIDAHRAPYFSITSEDTWPFDILAEEGITLDASLFPISIPGRGDCKSPRLPHEIRPGLLAWPMTSLPLQAAGLSCGSWPFSGGSYMRVLPFIVVRWATRLLETRGEPIVLYMHPYDLDRDHPVPRFRDMLRPRYLRLSSFEPRLKWALARARHIPLQAAAAAWWSIHRQSASPITTKVDR